MLENWRIWRRINWKQYSKENTEIRENFWVPEQVRDEDVSIKKKKRANVATNTQNKANRCFCTATLFKSQDWYSTGHASHTPLPDEGNKPMMDLARSLQTLSVHTSADVQTWYVRTQRIGMNTWRLRSVQMKRHLRLHKEPRGIVIPIQRQKQRHKTRTDSCQ